jgi:hypothetical protein
MLAACFGPPSDVSVWDRDGGGEADVLFTSIDRTLADDKCGSPAWPTTTPLAGSIRIFDVSDPAAPRHIESSDFPARSLRGAGL